MRKIVSIIGIVALILVLAGCDTATGGARLGDTGDAITGPVTTYPSTNEQLAKVIIPLPNDGALRSIGLGDAKAATNFYEVTFKRTDVEPPVYFSATATTDAQQLEVNIPAGTYDAVLFCGVKPNNGYYPLLLATSAVANTVIVLGPPTIITMNLILVDFAIQAPASVAIGDSITVTATAELNPFVCVQSLVMSVFNSTDSQIGSAIYATEVITGNTITYSFAPFTAPLSPETVEIRLSTFGSPYTINGTLWCIAAGNSGTTYGGVFEPYYTETITVGPGSGLPEVGITIVWPQ